MLTRVVIVNIDTPGDFLAAQKELATDLIMKERQIEVLIKSLPGIGKSEEAQEARLRELEKELEDAEEKRRKAVEERDALLEKLDKVIRGFEDPARRA